MIGPFAPPGPGAVPHETRLVIHCVFDRPLDYPDQVVIARQAILPGGQILHLPGRVAFPTVKAAVEHLESRGLTPLGRDPADVRSLVGTWI